MRSIFTLIIILSISSQYWIANAQPLSLPKLLPASFEDFRDYRSFPSVCFSEAHVDANGRLWLSNCAVANQVNLHLFQFDGYEFKQVKGALSKLNHLSTVYGFTKDDVAIGKLMENDSEYLFFFDLQTETLETLPLPKRTTINKVSIGEDDRIFCLVKGSNEFFLYELVNRKLVLINQFESPDEAQKKTNKPSYIREINENIVWQAKFDESYIERLYITPNQVEKTNIPIPAHEPRGKDDKWSNRFFYSTLRTNNTTYIKIHYPDRGWKLFKIVDGEARFRKIDFLPDFYQDIDAFKDKIGNLIFIFKRPTEALMEAILQDVDGNFYDYTAFINKSSVRTQNLISDDFRRELILCNRLGISIQKVQLNNAIQTYLEGIPLRSMLELDDQKYLIATQNNPKYILDRKTNEVSRLDMGDCSLFRNSMVLDSEGLIWGTDDNNLIAYDIKTNSCKKYPTGSQKRQYLLALPKDRFAVVQNSNQLIIYDVSTESYITFKPNGSVFKFEGFVHDWLYDGTFIWAATTAGLYQIDLVNNNFKLFGKEKPFPDRRFLCIYQDKKGRIWLGTPNNGLLIYDPSTKTMINLNSAKGLANNTVVSIVEDDDGNYWLGTYNGVSLVGPEGDLITNLGVEDGIVEAESNRYAKLKSSDGKIFIGTLKGLSIIDPELIRKSMVTVDNLRVYLTRLEYIDSETGNNKVINNGLNNLKEVHLPASNRSITIGLANSNYIKSSENKYAYMLEGIDENWIDMGNQNTIRLNRVPAGKHRLLVKSSDGIGNWTEVPLAINIRAREFFYKKTWFYLLCLLVITGAVFLWIRNLRSAVQKATRQIAADKATIEQQAEKLKELDKAKSRFFTNISHEFRTPLTIISGMIDQMMAKPEAWKEKGAKMIKQNTANLLDLVNQILDLRKLESNALKLDLIQGDIVAYSKYIFESFESLAKSKGINLHFLSEIDALEMAFDKEKILRIISNLLSNAIKFTPSGGNIYMLVSESSEDLLRISVKDTGKGIPKEKLPFIFDNFFQVDDTTQPEQDMGSGIGLALTAELVKLFGGNIKVESQVGKGSRFIISLPINQKIETNKQLDFKAMPSSKESKQEVFVENLEENDPREAILFTSSATEEKPLLLIVEDNEDVAEYLRACLEDGYQLLFARNGQLGIDKAVETIPDLIISDVMMPEKNGFELCDELKKDERTSHIPIVLLTAKASTDSRLQGLKYGADAYLTKPFNPKELFIRLEKLHQLRLQLQARFRSLEPDTSNLTTKEPVSELTQREVAFIEKLRIAIEANLSDENFGIVELCKVANMSRSQLHRKIKSLTNQPTSHFIRSVRLHQAKIFLKSGDLNVTEVAFEVGISNPAYFSRLFSKEFGMSPSEYLKT